MIPEPGCNKPTSIAGGAVEAARWKSIKAGGSPPGIAAIYNFDLFGGNANAAGSLEKIPHNNIHNFCGSSQYQGLDMGASLARLRVIHFSSVTTATLTIVGMSG